MFILCETDKTEAYVGEQILFTFSLYYATPLQSADYEPAKTEGFRTHPLPAPSRRYETVDGRRYVLQQELQLLFPTAPGTHTIGPATLQYSADFWDPVPKQITSEPITVTVSRLPDEGKPVTFSGVVGDLSVRSTLDRDTIKQGEAATLTAIVTGWGNVDAMDAPKVALPSGLREYRSSEHREFKPQAVGDSHRLQGEAVFDNVIIPTTVGDIAIPPVEVAYFSPETDRYEIARSRPLTLHVQPGDGAGLPGDGAMGPAAQLKPLPDRLSPRPVERLLSAPVLVSQLLATAWLVAAVVIRRRRAALEADPRWARSRAAARNAVGRIKYAAALQPAERGAHIAAAMAGYIADKLDIPPATVSATTVEAILSAHGIPPELSARAAELLRACDALRFSPTAGPGGQDELRQSAEGLVRDLERLLPRRPRGGVRNDAHPHPSHGGTGCHYLHVSGTGSRSPLSERDRELRRGRLPGRRVAVPRLPRCAGR